MTVTDPAVNHTRAAAEEACRESLRDVSMQRVEQCLAQVGLRSGNWREALRAVDRAPRTQQPLHQLKRAMACFGIDLADTGFERFVLLQAALETLSRLDDVSVSASVKQLLCHEFRVFAEAPGRQDSVRLGQTSFVEMAKLATLRRFPAGCLDWEVSGFPRRWLARIPPRRLPRVLSMVAAHLRGFKPLWDLHLKSRWGTFSLIEVEWNRSYFRLASSLALQPTVKGVMATSWLFSWDTHRIHPQLAWLNRSLEASGAVITDIGSAPMNAGFLVGSALRRRLYASGEYRPRIGLVLWPRENILEWAARHPEPAQPQSAPDPVGSTR